MPATLKYIFAVALLLFCQNIRSQDLKEVDESSLKELMNSNKGKTVMVNLWATWCAPCVEEFPELLKIREELNGKDFELVLISLDFGKNAKERTLEFLKDKGAEFRSYISAFSKDEDLINYFSSEWDGAIPATFVFNKDGTLSTALIGKRSYEQFMAELEKIM